MLETVTCKTVGCLLEGQILAPPDDGTEYRCSGGCGNILRVGSALEIPETLEEMIRRLIREELDPSA